MGPFPPLATVSVKNFTNLRGRHHADVSQVPAGHWEERHEEDVGQVGVEEDVGQAAVEGVGVAEQEQRDEGDPERKKDLFSLHPCCC